MQSADVPISKDPPNTAESVLDIQLRKSGLTVRGVIDGLGPNMLVGVLTPAGVLIEVNQAPLQAAGATAIDVLGRPFDQTPWWSYSAAAQEKLREAIGRAARGEPSRYDLLVPSANNQFIDVDFSLRPLRDSNGKVAFLIASGNIITEAKRVEDALRSSKSRMNSQIERMPLAYMSLGPDFRITCWNPAAERIFGFSEAEVLGKHPFDLIVPARSQPRVTEVLAKLMAGSMEAHTGAENITKDGRTITCEWHNTPLFSPSGAFQGVLSLGQDVTARREVEQTLNLRNRALEAVSQGILIVDPHLPDAPITYASPGFERLTGYPAHETIGRNCRFLQGVNTDPATVSQVRTAIAEERGCTVDLLNYRKDGTAFWNRLSISCIRDENGVLTHFVGLLTDVTEQRRLEENLRQAQKREAVGKLAGGIAHDFNNMLTIIAGYTEMLLDVTPCSDPRREHLQQIARASERSAELTNQLLAFSRKQMLAPRIINLNAVISETEEMLRHVIGEDILFTTVLHPQLDKVFADPGQMTQVLLNMSVNARDAMQVGGRFTIETHNVELDQNYADSHFGIKPGHYVLLAITDSGMGMSAEVQKQIFEPFFTTKELGKGTGLGLSVVQGIVKQSGGHIEVYSEMGVGTCFKIYLPRANRSETQTPIPRCLARGGMETILLVEDEGGVRALAQRVLESHGYTVVAASNASEAMELASNERLPLHLLLTDVVMPETGGRRLAEQLLQSRPALKVLYMSGYTDDAVVRHGVLHEKTNFLRKPFAPNVLAQTVRDVLDKVQCP